MYCQKGRYGTMPLSWNLASKPLTARSTHCYQGAEWARCIPAEEPPDRIHLEIQATDGLPCLLHQIKGRALQLVQDY